MIVKNNKPVGKWLFYKVNGMVAKVYVAGYGQTPDLADLTNEDQIIFNGHEKALRAVEDKFGKSFSNAWAVPSDPGSEFRNFSVSAVTYGTGAFTVTGGTLSPSGSTVQVPEGNNQIFTFTTLAGYFVSAITLDSVSVLNDVTDSAQTATYTIADITTDHAIRASYGYEVFNLSGVTDSVYTGGTISPSGLTNSIGRGEDQTFTMTPTASYYLTGVTDNNGLNQITAITGSVSAATTYTLTNIIANHEILIGFAAYGD